MLGHVRHNLPAPRTSLIGREHDISETLDLVLRGRERLVTLTGVGGSGKTRLALQVASGLKEAFPDGVWLVELASVSDPVLVPETVASALHFPEAPSDTPLSTLVTSLQSRDLLIIMDNCEHLIDACAMLVDSLLSACPNLRILATSREPLHVAGERQRRVPPLKVPEPGQVTSPGELARCPAVQLFVERAVAVEGSFQLTPENAKPIARICTLLDGIPLALELAAARVQVLSVVQIVQRLDDCFRLLAGNSRSAPTRQQTLRATLDWSYNLLSESEQIAFQRLSVFAGGWSLGAAEAVCAGEKLESTDVLDVLTRLVDKSLVLVEEQGGEALYRLLEPVRRYGEQHLAESGDEEATYTRLADFCIALAERAEPEMHGPQQAEWLRRLDREFDNIRAALQWADRRGDAETSLRLAGALYWHFWMRRHLHEGQRWLEAALNRGITLPPRLRAKGLFGVTLMLAMLGEYSKGITVGREAILHYRELGGPDGLAVVTVTMAMMMLSQRDLPAARALAGESISFARESGSWRPLAHACVIQGQVAHHEGDTPQAVDLHHEALAVFREHGDSWSISYAITNMASIQQDRADVTRAAALSTVQLYWEQDDYHSLAAALEYLACQGEMGHTEEQVRLFAAAHVLRQSIGAPLLVG